MDSNFAEKFKKAVTANFNQSKDPSAGMSV